LFHSIYKRLTPIEHKICEIIGITENYLVMFSSGQQQQQTNACLKRDVVIKANNDEIASSIVDFKAFAEVNKE
jgi:hypothetical protein